MSSSSSLHNTKLSFKVVLLGEGCVGKTSLVMRYLGNPFTEQHHATVQAAFHTKRITLQNQRLELNIWDTAGQEQYHALGPIYYRGADAAVLVYDITDHESFQRIQLWAKELRSMLGAIPMILVGNKSDLDGQRKVSSAEAQAYGDDLEAKLSREGATGLVCVLETSAKLNRNVDVVFLELAKRVLALRGDAQSDKGRSSVSGGSPVRKSLVVLESGKDESSRESRSQVSGGGCCVLS